MILTLSPSSRKPPQVAHLHRVIAIFGRGAELQFLDLDLFGLALGRMRLFLLLELELAEVHDAADRRICGWLNLNQIQTEFLRHIQRLVARQYSCLLAVGADHTYPRNTDLRILAVSFFSGDNSLSIKPGVADHGVQAAP